LQKAIGKYGRRLDTQLLQPALTPDKMAGLITPNSRRPPKSTRLGIPVIYGIDSIHGANYVQGLNPLSARKGDAANLNPS